MHLSCFAITMTVPCDTVEVCLNHDIGAAVSGCQNMLKLHYNDYLYTHARTHTPGSIKRKGLYSHK